MKEAGFASKFMRYNNNKGDDALAALCVLLVVACCYDYRDNRIPNYLIVLMAISGVGWQLCVEGSPGALLYLGKTALIIVLLYPFFKIGTVGAGDIKLLGVTAGYLPFRKILIFLFISLLIAAVISLIKMWKKNNFNERMQYLLGYLSDVLKCGCWWLYLENEKDKQSVGICLSGPVLLSMLLYLGGVY